MVKSPVFTAVAIASMFAVAAPAFAGTGDSVRRYKTQPTMRGDKLVYCVSQKAVASNIPDRTCMTKNEWVDAGAIVIEKNAQDYAAREQSVRQN